MKEEKTVVNSNFGFELDAGECSTYIKVNLGSYIFEKKFDFSLSIVTAILAAIVAGISSLNLLLKGFNWVDTIVVILYVLLLIGRVRSGN